MKYLERSDAEFEKIIKGNDLNEIRDAIAKIDKESFGSLTVEEYFDGMSDELSEEKILGIDIFQAEGLNQWLSREKKSLMKIASYSEMFSIESLSITDVACHSTDLYQDLEGKVNSNSLKIKEDFTYGDDQPGDRALAA